MNNGGINLSGKDPSHVEKTATLYCRYVAKTLVYHGLC